MSTDFCDSCRNFAIVKKETSNKYLCLSCLGGDINNLKNSIPTTIIPKKSRNQPLVNSGMHHLGSQKAESYSSVRDLTIELLFDNPEECYFTQEIIDYVRERNKRIDDFTVVTILGVLKKEGLIFSTYVKPNPSTERDKGKKLLYSAKEKNLKKSPKNKQLIDYLLEILDQHPFLFSEELAFRGKTNRGNILKAQDQYSDKILRCAIKDTQKIFYVLKKKYSVIKERLPNHRILKQKEDARFKGKTIKI